MNTGLSPHVKTPANPLSLHKIPPSPRYIKGQKDFLSKCEGSAPLHKHRETQISGFATAVYFSVK